MSKLREIVEATSGETREALEDLVHSLADSAKEVHRLEERIKYISQDNQLLRKRLFGSSSEKQLKEIFAQDDLGLFDEFDLCAQLVEPEQPNLPEIKHETQDKKPAGRKPLPSHLPREIVEHDLSDEEKQCVCGNEMEHIGSQKSEQLDYQPAKVTVLEHHCKKYVCACCRKANKKDPSLSVPMKTATKPAGLIPKSIATPSLLAQIVTHKFCDHLPLYRQESIFKRYSVDISRKTMSGWMIKVADAIIPLINLMQEKILDYDVSFSDETTVQVLKEPGRRAQSKSYMWCFIGGPENERIIIYQYHCSRKGEVVDNFFEGYAGALHCDGYAGYNAQITSENVTGINCMAHVRRKFVEALPQGKEKGVSGYVVKLIRSLYKIESMLKDTGADSNKIREVRQQQAMPLLAQLKTYLDEKIKVVPPRSKVGEAIKYTLKRWDYLTTYVQDGRYEIDNNRAERAIKPFVMGRKAWLFANSPSGAHASSRLFSLVETAKANGIEPSSYLTQIFKELPNCTKVEDYEALLPWKIKLKSKI